MKFHLLLIPLIFSLFLSCQNQKKERYYLNPYFVTSEYLQDNPPFFKEVPKVLDEQTATETVATHPDSKKILQGAPDSVLIVLEIPYTEDHGKTWRPWEVGIGQIYKNYAVRIDAVFGVDAMTGKVERLNKPIIYLAYQGSPEEPEEEPPLEIPSE